MANAPKAERTHRGSFLAAEYELRITRRCLEEDLGLRSDSDFAEALRQDIVRGFVKQRRSDPGGGKTVGPAAGSRTLYRLARGDDHRGATWYDEEHGVVWLCAYGQHRSGQTADAFPHFERLRTERRIKPGPEDYKALFAERAMRFVDLVGDDAQALLAEARAAAGQEHVGVVGGEMTVAVLLDAVGAIEETYVVLSVMQITHPRLVTVLAAFYPDASFADWELVDRLPVRVLSSDAGEFGYRILPS